jgi:hypothetical protein
MNFLTTFVNRNELKISRIVTAILFLALIRSIIEPLIQSMPWTELHRLTIGCLIAAIACLVVTFLGFYSKYKAAIVTGIVAIIALVVFKSVFMT